MPTNDDNAHARVPGDSSGGGLSCYAGHRIAITFKHGCQCHILTGVASFGRERMLGNVLRIRLDDQSDGAPVIVLGEQEWDGKIVADPIHGCEYSLVLDRN